MSTGGMQHWLAVTVVAVLALVTGGVYLSTMSRNGDEIAAAAYTPPPVTTPTPTPSQEPDVLAVIGDSWTAGSVADSASTSFAPQVARSLGATLVRLGAGSTGYTASNDKGDGPFGTRVDAAIQAGADIVVVQGSSNDYAASEDEIYDAALDVFTRLRDGLPDARIYAMGMLHSPSSPTKADETSLRAVSAASRQAGVTFIDGNTDAWLQIPADFADGYHPNQVGHDKVAAKLTEALSASNPDKG